MKPLTFLAVKGAFLLILGILAGYWLDISPTLALLFAASSILALALAYLLSNRKSILFGICSAIATLSTGMISYSLSTEINHKGHFQEAIRSGEQLWHLRIVQSDKPTTYNQVYIARVLSLDQKPARGSIQLRINRSDLDTIEVDDEMLVWGRAQKFKGPLNPYQWDYGNYMRKRNIHHQIRTSAPNIHLLNSSFHSIRGRAYRLREGISEKLDETGIPERELSIVKALLLGKRGDITTDTFDAYRKAGAIHILAISGLHVGIILVLLRFMLQPLTKLAGGKEFALVISVVFLWGYSFLAGFSPSVIRAVAMFSFLAYSLFLNRITHAYNTLALSLLFLLLLINPLLIFEVGFQMSYAAVGAILWIYPLLVKIWQPRFQIIKQIWQVAAVSLSAQLGVLPISLFYFHQFPGLFLISSLVVIPFLGLILATGFAVSFLALINFLPDLLAELYGMIIFCLNEFIGWVSRMENFYLEELHFGPLELMLTYILIYSLIRLLQKPSAQKFCYALVFLLSIQICGVYYLWDTRNTSRVLIGHQYGDALLIEQNGKALTAYTSARSINPHTIRSYKLGARTRQFQQEPLKNSYFIHGESLIRMDSSLILLFQDKTDYLWLTHAPRINLDRYLALHTPKQIIADGSSPPYLISRWEQSASSRNIPFHYTARNGAFEF